MESASAAQDETPGQDPPTSVKAPAHGPAGKSRPGTLLRRWKVLIDPRSQLRSVAMVGLFTLALLVPINLGLHVVHVANAAQIAAGAPTLSDTIEEQNRAAAMQVWIGSGVILLAAMSITLLATHRTAGAAFSLSRGIQALCEGNYGARTVLRRGDRLRNVERSLNELSRALLEQSRRAADDLDRVAEAVDRISDPQEARAAAERLRQMARQRAAGV